MRRFLALALLGGTVALAGHALISLGLHPERMASITALLQGCAALVGGTALFVTGMLGLAEAYEKTAGRFLEVKQPPEADSKGLVVDIAGLQTASHGFWQGYAGTGAGVALFMAGLLGLTLALAQTSPTLFMVGLVAGIVCLVVAASTLCVRGLSRARRAQVALDRSCVTMAGQPDRATQRQEPRHPKRAPRYKLFPRGATSGRHLDRLSRGSRARTGS